MLTFTFLKEEVRSFDVENKIFILYFSSNERKQFVKVLSIVHGRVFRILILFGKISNSSFYNLGCFFFVEHQRVMIHSHPILNYQVMLPNVSGLEFHPVRSVWLIHYVIPVMHIETMNDNGLYKYFPLVSSHYLSSFFLCLVKSIG